VTFYPSVWRWNGNDRYMLVQASTVTYIPQLGGAAFICDNNTDQQIDVLTNYTIGLRTFTTSQILTTGESDNNLTYSAEGSYNSITINGDDGRVIQRRFHIAVLAEISK